MPPPLKKDVFKGLYEQLDRQTLARQGTGHLTGRADLAAKRTGRWLWLVVWTLVGGAVLVGGLFSLWALQTAKASGQSLHEVRDQALKAYSDEPAE